MRDNYRTRAAEFDARARMESDEGIRRQYESLAKQYSRLAEGVDQRRRRIGFTSHRRSKFQIEVTRLAIAVS